MYLLFLILTAISPQISVKQNTLIEHHQNAEAAMQKKEYEKAVYFYTQLIQECKKKAMFPSQCQEVGDTYLRIAEALILLNEPLEATKYLQELLSFHPADLLACKANFFLANCSNSLGDPVTALKQIHEIKHRWSPMLWPNKLPIFEKTLHLMLNNHFDALWQRAKRAYQIEYYADAKVLFSQVQDAIDQKVYPRAFQNNLFQKRVDFFLAKTRLMLQYQEKDATALADAETLFLKAMSYKKTADYQHAIALFEECILSVEEPQQLAEAHSELGFLYKKSGNLFLAKQHFNRVLKTSNTTTNLAILVRLQLATIQLEEQDLIHAEHHLHYLSTLSLSKPLTEEISFLQGKLYLYQGKKQKAEKAFNKALSISRRHREEIILLTTLCQLQEECSPEQLATLTSSCPSYPEKSALIIAQALAFHQKNASLLEHLQNNSSHFEDPQLKFLMTALSKPTGERDSLIKEATSSDLVTSIYFPLNWLLQGVEQIKSSQEEALFSLETAYSLFQASKKNHDLFTQLYLQNIQEKIEKMAKCVFQKGSDSLDSYLYSFVLANSPYVKKKKFAVEQLLLALEQEPAYSDHLHYMIGSLFFELKEPLKAYEHFLSITKRYPYSSLNSAALFWAAECQEKLDPAKSILHRKELLLNDPMSPFAPKAYFKYYSLAAYLKKEKRAIDHLKKFSSLFPLSSLNVCGFYLLALAEEEHAEELLQKAIYSYEQCEASKKQGGALFFLLSAKLKLAWLYFEKDELEQSLSLSKSILQTLSVESEAKAFIESNGQCSIKDECCLLLAQTYFKQKEFSPAQLLLSSTLQEYEMKGINRGCLLARFWLLQAELLLEQKKQLLAEECMELAQRASEGFYSSEFKKTLLEFQVKLTTFTPSQN